MPIVMTDLLGTAPVLGEAFLIPDDGRYSYHQRLGLVPVTYESGLEKGYFYWLLNWHDDRRQVRAQQAGRPSATRRLSVSRTSLSDCRLTWTVSARLHAQSLFAYDDLLDNNRRRIKLLEDSVRLLFDERFVRLRFPDEVSARPGAGLPAGWPRLRLEELLGLQRGINLPSRDREAGGTPIFGSTGNVGTHNIAKVPGPGIVTGRPGTLGDVHFVGGDFRPLNTALWVKEFKRVTPLFALHLLHSMNLEQYNGGVSVPTLDRKVVHKATVVLPPGPLMERFEMMARDVQRQIDTLTKMNIKLRAARDLLLPRLMSGALTVWAEIAHACCDQPGDADVSGAHPGCTHVSAYRAQVGARRRGRRRACSPEQTRAEAETVILDQVFLLPEPPYTPCPR